MFFKEKKNKKRLTKRHTLLTNKQMNPEKEEKEMVVGFLAFIFYGKTTKLC